MLSGSALLPLRANWQAQMRRYPDIPRDIELPSHEGNPPAEEASRLNAFQMLFVANAGRRASLAGSPLFMSEAHGETG